MTTMTKDIKPVFIYWDHSKLFIAAKTVAEQEERADARYRVRLNFDNLFNLARADRPVGRAFAAGSIPPGMAMLWNRLESAGLEVTKQQRGELGGGEQDVDQELQLRMLEDGFDHSDHPGTVVLMTGDGSGFKEGTGFHSTLERLRKRGWGIEVLSWQHSCNQAMRNWVESVGVFVSLDDYYEQVTFLEPSQPGRSYDNPRDSAPLDLSGRQTA